MHRKLSWVLAIASAGGLSWGGSHNAESAEALAPMSRTAESTNTKAPFHKLSINIPKAGQAADKTETYRAKKGDVVMLNISSDREGTIMIHGLADGGAVKKGQSTMVVALKFAGTFGIHFHGKDGSHIEVGALEIY